MARKGLLSHRVQGVPCRIEIEHTHDSLHAHVEFLREVGIQPGDSVTIDGEKIEVPFGESRVFERTASVVHAGLLERLWTRMTGDLEFMELCEFSFSERRVS